MRVLFEMAYIKIFRLLLAILWYIHTRFMNYIDIKDVYQTFLYPVVAIGQKARKRPLNKHTCTSKLPAAQSLTLLHFLNCTKSLITSSFLDSLHVDFRFHYFKMRQREGAGIYSSHMHCSKLDPKRGEQPNIPTFPTLRYTCIFASFSYQKISYLSKAQFTCP